MAMESLLAKALESKLKYWLKSFTREQFKLRGRTVQLCNLDLNGEVLHASIGLPPTLLVSQARVGKLELKVPPLSNVQVEPVVVEIDKLDLVLVEKSGSQPDTMPQASPGTSATVRSSSYGFADKIADGVTLQVGTVNLLLETRGGTAGQEGASWTPPLAAITIRNLLLYTTNEGWQVVNLKEARDFSNNKRCIYVFKTLEWESLSVDLLPHPDMFSDERLTSSKVKADDDGAKRLFFGGERFLDNISGKAFITMHRTEQNNPLGLEVQVHVPEAICSALSEPGLRALLRFMTGMYVCMNRGDVGPRSTQSGAEAAGHSMVSVKVDHIFLCIKDADFQLELLLQSLQYMRSTVTNGELTKTMARICIGGLFLRDTFSHPCSTLVQPAMQDRSCEQPPVPNFASEKLWPRIYPLSDPTSTSTVAPLLCMYSVQMVPSPAPPVLASQTVVQCQPLKVELHEESCLRLASFLVDGVVVEHGVVTPTTSVDSMYFTLKQLDLVIPVEVADHGGEFQDISGNHEFTGVRLHVKDFIFVQSPSLNFKTLELEKDPACFMLWQGQPIDASQRRWVMRAMQMSVALETGNYDAMDGQCELGLSAGLWRCIEMTEPCIEVAMVTGDGDPILTVPPPGGTVRFGVHCKQLTSNTSVEQLFFVLKMYEHLGNVNESLLKVTRTSKKVKPAVVSRGSSMKTLGSFGSILEMAPSDTAVSLGLGLLELKFLELLFEHKEMQGPPLVQISGSEVGLKVTHRTLGGAIAIASKLSWLDILVECVETDKFSASSFELPSKGRSELKSSMRPVFWISNGKYEARCNGSSNHAVSSNEQHFLDIDVTNVIPYRPEDAECHSVRVMAQISGIRLGGGMVYSEALLHHFGVLGPDGGPGKGLKRILKNLSNGPFASLLKPPPQVVIQDEASANNNQQWELGVPDEIEVNIQLKDWIFALEGLEADSEQTENAFLRGERCWHSAFQCLGITAEGGHKDLDGENGRLFSKHPVQRIIVGIEGLEFIKPYSLNDMSAQPSMCNDTSDDGLRKGSKFLKRNGGMQSGLDVEVLFGLREDEADADMHMGQWAIKSIRSGIKKPVEVEATKEEVEYLIETVRLEIGSASRIASGLMQLLELQGSIGQAAIKQLSSIGTDSLDRLITPEKVGRRSSIGSVGSIPSYNGNLHEKSSLDSYLSRLEQAVLNSQEICAKLGSKLMESKCSNREEVSCELLSLTRQLNEMEHLLAKSRNAV